MNGIGQAVKWGIISVLFFAVVGMVTSAITGIFRVIEDMNARNSVLGEAKIIDYWEDFDIFDVDAGNYMDFYQNGDTFTYSRDYLVKYEKEFDGTAQQFNLLVNGQPSTRTVAVFGQLFATHQLRFLDVDGSVKDIIELEFEFIFYSDSVKLTISTNTTHMGLLRQYVAVRGFRFRLIEEIYNPVSNTGNPSHVFVFFESAGETKQISWVPHNTVFVPAINVPAGYEIYSMSVDGKEIDINTYKFTEPTTVEMEITKIGFKRLTATFTNGLWSEKVTYTNEKTITFPEPPEIDRFNFVGWDRQEISYDESLTYTAQYELAQGYEGCTLSIYNRLTGTAEINGFFLSCAIKSSGRLIGEITLTHELGGYETVHQIEFLVSELPDISSSKKFTFIDYIGEKTMPDDTFNVKTVFVSFRNLWNLNSYIRLSSDRMTSIKSIKFYYAQEIQW